MRFETTEFGASDEDVAQQMFQKNRDPTPYFPYHFKSTGNQ